ncbi:CAAX protease [Microbacterium protaetiae]|uniref:CAAX protease n=1 Tax=Microbacterium protaetiae TaxID=2509458 RepID=A0A4P6EE09_9MICO|nr:CAAX protease [Microbacterium protaetiae]QAY59986.1 CAAX protease [Microbacterium protaetiae]
MDLYRWASRIALATFDDLSTLEVAMRSAMARELAAAHGLYWYRRTDLLDDDTLKLVGEAWRVGRLSTLDAPPEVLHGKLVATLMFGFWVKVLGRGGYQGSGEDRERRIYDTLLWKPALRNAFPNVGNFDRSTVETAARRVQSLRNRVAHHEHIVWGVPLAGERRKDGSVRRIRVSEMHETVLNLAGYIDTGLESWLRENSAVPSQIANCPLPDRTALLL